MNNLEALTLRRLIIRQLNKHQQEELISNTLVEALGFKNDFESQIMDILSKQAYIQPDGIRLSTSSIDELLQFAIDKELTFDYGIGSILETYVMNELSRILDLDLLEWV